MMAISLILAESALEIIPRELHSHPAVASHARRTGKAPGGMLLDTSWHYAAMRRLRDAERRARPDLVHLAMVTATSAPLYQKHNKLAVYVHTVDDHVIHLGSGVRVPKSYHRFAGLVESLYEDRGAAAHGMRPRDSAGLHRHAGGRGRGRGAEPLMALKKGQTFLQLIRECGFSRVVGLSSEGRLPDSPHPFEAVAESIVCDNNNNSKNDVAVVIGGFQRGHFSRRILDHVDELYAVDSRPLEAHVVIARILYECEKKPFM